jgi:hypothetical protein
MRKFFLLVFCLLESVICHAVYELSITAMFRNEGRFLEEWIEYHRMVGVEHFFLYNDRSDDNYAEILAPYEAEGIVEVMSWPSKDLYDLYPLDVLLDRVSCQVLAYRDALAKGKGLTKWLAILDLDEYLLPAEEATVTECLSKHFSDASAVYINWFHFGTNLVHLNPGDSLLLNLTACGDKAHPTNCIGKSIVRPEQTQEHLLWNPHHAVLQEDARYFNGDAEPIEPLGLDLKLDGMAHNHYLRLNHYTMRDENYFHFVKMPIAKILGNENLALEHYFAFNLYRDTSIIQFIRAKHPDMWEKFWKSRCKIL